MEKRDMAVFFDSGLIRTQKRAAWMLHGTVLVFSLGFCAVLLLAKNYINAMAVGGLILIYSISILLTMRKKAVKTKFFLSYVFSTLMLTVCWDYVFVMFVWFVFFWQEPLLELLILLAITQFLGWLLLAVYFLTANNAGKKSRLVLVLAYLVSCFGGLCFMGPTVTPPRNFAELFGLGATGLASLFVWFLVTLGMHGFVESVVKHRYSKKFGLDITQYMFTPIKRKRRR